MRRITKNVALQMKESDLYFEDCIIEHCAFMYCTTIRKLVLKNVLLQHSCFHACSVRELYIENDFIIKNDKDYCDQFSRCTQLRTVKLTNVSIIPIGCFILCTNLSNIKIPNGVEKISEHAFRESGLITVTIPKTTHVIEHRAFNLCRQMESVFIENGNTFLNICEEAFDFCKQINQFVIPSECQFTLGINCLLSCELLKHEFNLTMCTSIGESALRWTIMPIRILHNQLDLMKHQEHEGVITVDDEDEINDMLLNFIPIEIVRIIWNFNTFGLNLRRKI